MNAQEIEILEHRISRILDTRINIREVKAQEIGGKTIRTYGIEITREEKTT